MTSRRASATAGAVALDTSALLRWVLQEFGWQAVHALLNKAETTVLPGPVLTELVERAHAKGNTAAPTEIYDVLLAHGCRVEHPTDTDLLRAAELIATSKTHPLVKGKRTMTLSLGDGLILAVVERLDVPVVTADSFWPHFADNGHTTARVVPLARPTGP